MPDSSDDLERPFGGSTFVPGSATSHGAPGGDSKGVQKKTKKKKRRKDKNLELTSRSSGAPASASAKAASGGTSIPLALPSKLPLWLAAVAISRMVTA